MLSPIVTHLLLLSWPNSLKAQQERWNYLDALWHHSLLHRKKKKKP
jgi:hypothetical protein